MAKQTTIKQDGNRLWVHMIATSELVETDAQKVDLSAYKKLNGETPTKLSLLQVQFCTFGVTGVVLEADHTTDYVLAVLQGTGKFDYSGYHGVVDEGSGGTGDLILTGLGTSGSYNILAEFELI